MKMGSIMATSLFKLPVGGKDIRGKNEILSCEFLREARTNARGFIVSADAAVRIRRCATEPEDLIHADDVALHARLLLNGNEPPPPVRTAGKLYHHVNGGRDL